jgi:NHLM bacteriocin system ABC transporter ATP-binding protein
MSTPTSSAPSTAADLATLAAQASPPAAMGGNRPILLTDPNQLMVVVAGSVDLFSVPVNGNTVDGAREYIGQVAAGGLLMGMSQVDANGSLPFAVLAVGATNTLISMLDRAWLASVLGQPELQPALAAGIDAWIAALAGVFIDDVPPSTAITLLPGQPATLHSGADAIPGQRVVWVRAAADSVLIGGDKTQPALPADSWFPLAQVGSASNVWIRAATDATLTTCSTLDLIRTQALTAAIAVVHPALVSGVRRRHLAILADAQAQIEERAALVQVKTATAAHQLAQSMRLSQRASAVRMAPAAAGVADDMSVLLAACQLVGDALDIVFSPPTEAERVLANRDPLAQITFASRIRSRRVRLTSDWWSGDSGPLLGYLADGSPVALLPRSTSSYEAVDPRTMQRTRVDAAYAEKLQDDAYIFYRRLHDEPVTIGDTIRFSLRGLGMDLSLIFVFGMALALLGLLVPIATGWLVDTVIPSGRRSDLVALGIALVAAAVAAMLFNIAQQFAVLRLQTKSTAALSAATWDRLLGLPAGFFRQYTAGDLANRAYGVSRIRQLVSDATVTAMVSGLFSLVNFALLFYYSPQLALVAVGVAVVVLLVTLSTSYFQLNLRRKVSDMQGLVSGVALQLLNGVTKLRVAGAEANALGVWATVYAKQQHYTYAAGTIDNALRTFESIIPLLSSICLFAAIGYWLGGSAFETGAFVAFNVAFSQFLNAAIKQVNAFTSVLEAVPYYERAKPILDMLPEVTSDKVDPGTLSGRVDVNHVQFRYSEEGPLILRDISLHARPGEMIGLVGPSGAGKSTIIRMLLGFETPSAGGVFYDNQDLKSLNVQAVRRQIGVVLQDGKVMPGTVFDNIVGASLLTEADAWEAARVAGLDQDIKLMPMGMQTAIAEGGTTFSGGQLQRLMIARAVVGKPRILIFDEATSALDNETQALVSKNLDALQVTRIVIAHRLSTIVNADYIFVLEAGAVVQDGTYDELMAQEGLFRELAKRQLA